MNFPPPRGLSPFLNIRCNLQLLLPILNLSHDLQDTTFTLSPPPLPRMHYQSTFLPSFHYPPQTIKPSINHSLTLTRRPTTLTRHAHLSDHRSHLIIRGDDRPATSTLHSSITQQHFHHGNQYIGYVRLLFPILGRDPSILSRLRMVLTFFFSPKARHRFGDAALVESGGISTIRAAGYKVARMIGVGSAS